MTDERIIPAPGEASAVTQSLLVGGRELPPTVEVLSIETLREANRVPSARIVVRDGDVAAEDFPLSNEDHFVPGNEIEIRLGYASNEQTVFRGIIVKHAISVRSSRSSTLTVECRDAAVRMTIGRHSRFYVGKSDSDVFKQLLSEHDLKSDVAATTLKHAELVQYHASDWDFMLSRADANGMLVLVDDGTVVVGPPKTGGDPDLAILLGDTVYELDAEMDARHHYKSVTAHGWDFSKQGVVIERGKPPPSSRQGNVSESELAATIDLDAYEFRHPGRRDAQELQAWASSQLVRGSLAKIVGRARIPGFASIKPGQLIDVNGVGKRFSGTAFVAGVRHEVTSGTWRTDVQFGLAPERYPQREEINDYPAAGLLPAFHGMQIGIATALEGDPQGEDRIRVKLPLVDPQADGIWARWVSPDAGADRGVYFRPEIGDELIVGFLNQDPRDPVVLGMVHSSRHPSPIPLSNDNHAKAIVTRSKMRLHFDDDKQVLTLDTPGGNSVVVSDEDQGIKLTDQHGNSITMDGNGITLDASKITLKAQQEVAIEAGTDCRVQSGMGAEIKAGTQFKAEGSAGAELSTSAVATIKGSLVKIN